MSQIEARTNDELKADLFGHLRKLSEFQTESAKIEWVRTEVDKLLIKTTEESKCLKGCHFCCYHPISLSQVEMEEIKSEGVTPEQSRLEKQIEHFQDSRPIDYENRACVYLKEGECSVYEKRPLICRLTHVKSPPEDCHFENEEKPIEHLPVTKAALLVGAFYMAHPDVEIMSVLLQGTDKT